MSVEENKALVRRFIDAVNHDNLAVFDELFAPDFVPRDTVVPIPPGPAGIRQLFAAVRRAFPDLHETLDDVLAEGDKVMARWTVRATHRGAFAGIPPTGKPVVWRGMFVLRVVDGTFREVWQVHDQLGLLQQLGATVMPPEPGTG
jgi:steroid delta-isomerase-like uncharacterized protein